MEDLIDFACSDTWLDYYHARGLTWRHSIPAPDHNQEHITRLLDKQAALEREIARLRGQLARMSSARQPPITPTIPITQSEIHGVDLPK